MDICITDTDAKLYDGFSSEKVLEGSAKLKKNKYEAPCIARLHLFAPLIYLVDGITCKEAKAFEKCVVLLMAPKHV